MRKYKERKLPIDGKWKCPMCNEYKLPEEFHNNSSTINGLEHQCKKCRKNYYTTEGRASKYMMKQKFNMTIEQYDELLEKQNGVCAICGRLNTDPQKGRFCIDHDHKTGKVRGLLCTKCNIALGDFDDNINSLAKAIKYLTQ